MTKIKRFTIAAVLCIMGIMNMSSTSVLASDSSELKAYTKDADFLTSNGTSKDVSYEQAINIISKSRGITYTEAEQFLQLNTKQSALRTTSYKYYEVYADAGAGLLVNAWALMEMWSEGSFAQFQRVVDQGSALLGWSSYTWTPSINAILTTPQQLDLYCRGSATIQVDKSMSGAAEFGSSLLGASFTVSATVGKSVYYTKMITFSHQWRLMQ